MLGKGAGPAVNNRLLDKIRDCADLPSLPAVALRDMDITQNADVTSQQVSEAISMDPALVAKVLRTVNSPFYGCSQAISSINGAVVLLGMQSVKTLVLGFSIVSSLAAQKTKSFDHVTYWRRSLYAATAARILGARVWVTEKEACFLAALLMDVGMLVMDKMLGDAYAACVAKARNHAELMAAEDKAFEINHQQVARILAEKWMLPGLLTVPMSNHHPSCSSPARACAAWWLVSLYFDLSVPHLGWFAAGGLILFGLFGVVVSLRGGEHAAPPDEPVERQEDPGPAHTPPSVA